MVLLLTAKPKITVDYVAEYNRITRPENYDPNDNAAPYYQKAFDAFVEMPDVLWSLYIDWPADYNSDEQALLENWLTSNAPAFEYFKEAVNKPYYWVERKSEEDDSVDYIILPDEIGLRELTKALGWDAKLKAAKGQFQLAFENILECYKAGSHKCRPTLFLMEQHCGLSIKQDAVHSAFVILDKSKVDNKILKFFQDALQVEFDSDAYIPSVQTEKYFLYDRVQRYFIDNGRGTGRLAFSVGLKYITLGDTWSNLKRELYYCFIGPTKNQVIKQIEQVIAISDRIMTKTPWQIKSGGGDYLKEMQNIKGSRDVLEHIRGSTESIFHSYYKTRAQTEALIAVLAILRYKADTGQFPESLDKLVSTGYLKSVPTDPYSDGPLVYKPTEGNFKLYSVGEDFVDDGGVIEIRTRQKSGFIRGTHTESYLYAPDIVYWPVKELEKLRYKFSFEETEKLKAEKEAEGQRKIEEANQPNSY
jgi:hypothetical protein